MKKESEKATKEGKKENEESAPKHRVRIRQQDFSKALNMMARRVQRQPEEFRNRFGTTGMASSWRAGSVRSTGKRWKEQQKGLWWTGWMGFVAERNRKQDSR